MYQNAVNQGYAAQTIGGANAQTIPAPPKTLASALGRVDGLASRLAEVRNRLGHLADIIGGPRGINGQASEKEPPPRSAITHLNDSADAAHAVVSDIEDLIAHITNALG
jgi:hypothetical protein